MDVLLARRKPRSEGQASFWAAHVMMCDGEVCNELRYETDRRIFIGRGHSIISPQIMDAPHHTNSVGAVLDPIFSLRRKIRIPAFGRAAVAFTTLVAATREDALAAAGKYREPGIVSRTFELSATHSQLLLQQLSITSEEAQAFQRLAGRLLFLIHRFVPDHSFCPATSGHNPRCGPMEYPEICRFALSVWKTVAR